MFSDFAFEHISIIGWLATQNSITGLIFACSYVTLPYKVLYIRSKQPRIDNFECVFQVIESHNNIKGINVEFIRDYFKHNKLDGIVFIVFSLISLSCLAIRIIIGKVILIMK